MISKLQEINRDFFLNNRYLFFLIEVIFHYFILHNRIFNFDKDKK